MKPYLYLARTKTREGGLELLRLHLIHPEVKGKSILINSGAPGAQVFRAHDDPLAKAGSLEPLPEGRYAISLPIYREAGEIWPAGIGDRTMPLTPLDRLVGGRSAFEIHPDANRLTSPGSAGCPCTITTEDWGRVAYWVAELKARTFYVDWGLGKVRLPAGHKLDSAESEPSTKTTTVNLDGKKIGEALLIDGTSYLSAVTVAKLLGLGHAWDAKTKTLELTR